MPTYNKMPYLEEARLALLSFTEVARFIVELYFNECDVDNSISVHSTWPPCGVIVDFCAKKKTEMLI